MPSATRTALLPCLCPGGGRGRRHAGCAVGDGHGCEWHWHVATGGECPFRSVDTAVLLVFSVPFVLRGFFTVRLLRCCAPQSKEAEAFAASAKEADDIEYVQTDKPAVAKALGLSASKAAALAVVKKEDDKFVSFGEPTEHAFSSFFGCFFSGAERVWIVSLFLFLFVTLFWGPGLDLACAPSPPPWLQRASTRRTPSLSLRWPTVCPSWCRSPTTPCSSSSGAPSRRWSDPHAPWTPSLCPFARLRHEGR